MFYEAPVFIPSLGLSQISQLSLGLAHFSSLPMKPKGYQDCCMAGAITTLQPGQVFVNSQCQGTKSTSFKVVERATVKSESPYKAYEN